tara:strand:- start:820 stop:1026 length:207 start_codon:yes stop_codon:yes gene_type:complete
VNEDATTRTFLIDYFFQVFILLVFILDACLLLRRAIMFDFMHVYMHASKQASKQRVMSNRIPSFAHIK